MTELKDKIVMVTGTSAGIGEACARAFAERGARLIIAARRLDRLKKLAESLNTPGHLIQLDVRDREAVDRAIESLPAEWAEIDILVNNAGLSRDLSKIQEGRHESWEQMIDTNVKGLLFVSRAVLPGMVKRGRGHVINIGSIAGHEVYPGGNVYCATKHAVDAITKGMRLDLLGTGVKVSTVDPGMVETEFSLVRFYGDKEKADKVYQGLTPLSGDDIARAVVWVSEQPPHVQVAEVIMLPLDQASATQANRRS